METGLSHQAGDQDMKRVRVTFAVVALLVLTACTGSPPGVVEPTAANNMIFSSSAAADRLVQGPQRGLSRAKPVLVASLVNINGLDRSSGLGRVIGEQISSRLVASGYTIAELKLRNSVLIKEGKGEFVLSRDVREITRSRGAQAVIAGTYAVGADSVYVNVRLIRATDGKILSSYDYTLPLDDNVLFLVGARFRDLR